DLLGEADAARALDAAVHVEDDVGAQGDALAPRIGPLVLVLETRVGDAVLEGVVLQAALAGLIADRAIQRVIDEEELHHPLLRLGDLGGIRAHRPAVLHHVGGAGGLELRHLLATVRDLDVVYASLGHHREAGVIAVVGDQDAGFEARVDHVGAGLHLHGAVVDGDFGHGLFTLRSRNSAAGGRGTPARARAARSPRGNDRPAT